MKQSFTFQEVLNFIEAQPDDKKTNFSLSCKRAGFCGCVMVQFFDSVLPESALFDYVNGPGHIAHSTNEENIAHISDHNWAAYDIGLFLHGHNPNGLHGLPIRNIGKTGINPFKTFGEMKAYLLPLFSE